MTAADFDLRIDYFHGTDDATLARLGAARELLPPPERWRSEFEADLARPPAERSAYAIVWELDGEPIGFSSADRIEVGEEAHMHLHIISPGNRREGLGTELVGLTARHYFELFDLRSLLCEPNAFNVAPNRTLQAAGFRYVRTVEGAPTPMNPMQPLTVWVLERSTD